jgi:hypothetical protein
MLPSLVTLFLLLISNTAKACLDHDDVPVSSTRRRRRLMGGLAASQLQEESRTVPPETTKRQQPPLQQVRATKNSQHCGTKDPTLLERMVANKVTDNWLSEHDCQSSPVVVATRNPHCHIPTTTAKQSTSSSPIRIPVKWHSLAKDDGSSAVTDQQILDSIQALNEAFAHSSSGGFAFDFDIASDKTETWNSDWHAAKDDLEYKSELRQGGCTTLNIYSAATPDDIFGWGTKPYSCDDDYGDCINRCKEDYAYDGVVIRYELVRGGPVEEYNEGDVLIHEVRVEIEGKMG